MSNLQTIVDGTNVLTVDQHVRHWWEILTSFEQRNSYAIADSVRQRGDVEEQGGTIGHAIRRVFLGSHRGFVLHVTDNAGTIAMRLRRPFYWFLSDMTVEDSNGRAIGRVLKRWRIFSKTYDLFEG
ncbi:MAG TPA: phospholipid scramblase-related protein, partial [Thermoanaerobaculia bacterium]